MPNTGNIGLEVPLTGTLPGTWGSAALNPDFVAIDGLFGGTVTIPITGGTLTLAAPAGKSISPTAGPVQSQNRVLRFTGTLASDETVTLPLPGSYIVENLTSGAFNLILRGAAATTEVIAIPPGARLTIYNDGSRVRFADLGKPGQSEFWNGRTAIPAWVTACTIKPYLLEDGTVYNIADYPWLGGILLGQFGGDGVTTFAVPDKRGRVTLPYDGTGTRITTAGCGIDGQTIGAAGGTQFITMARANLPNDLVVVTIVDNGHNHGVSGGTLGGTSTGLGANPSTAFLTGATAIIINSNVTGISASFNLNGGQAQTNMRNVQPSIVAGISVVKT